MEPRSRPRGELRIGLWGPFDAESYGPALLPRIVRHELGRRLPAAVVRTFGILGERSPSRFDGGPLEPLGEPTPERLADLATSLDVVIVAGEMHVRDEGWAADYPVDPREVSRLAPSRFFLDGFGRELEEECPVLWHAIAVPSDIDEREAPRVRRALEARLHVSVRDRASLRRLRAAGVVREVAVVPDPTVLLPRVLPRDLLADRARALRDAGTLPPDRSLIVQGGRGDLDHVDAIGGAVRDLAGRNGAVPLGVETGRGDGEFAAAFGERVPEARRLGPAGIVDLTAAIAASVGFVGSSRHGAVVALSYGRPPVVLALGGDPGDDAGVLDPDAVARDADRIPDAFDASAASPVAELVGDLEERADAEVDALADVALKVSRGSAAVNPGDLEDAYAARGRRLVAQRWRMADRLAEVEEEVAAGREEQRALRAEVARLEGEVAGKQGELDRLMATRTFRYTAAARRAYGRLRSWFRRG